MNFNTFALNYTIFLFFGLIICLKTGHLIGRRRHPHEEETGGSEAIDAALFALLGLFLGFTFSSALDSYGAHRDLLTKEANDIAIVYTSLDLLPDQYQQPLRPLMRQYAQTRLEATEAVMDSQEEQQALANGLLIKQQIWQHIVQYAKTSKNPAIASQIIDSFDTMVNAPDDQIAEQRNNTPKIIYVLIIVLALLSSMIAGYGMADYRKLPLIRVLIFSISVALTMYVIIDLEYPRSGFFNSVPVNFMLADAIAEMK